MSSEVMLRGLHEYGLKNIVAPAADQVLVELAMTCATCSLAVIATNYKPFLPIDSKTVISDTTLEYLLYEYVY